ncbi:MAG: hypothetical protein ACXWMS_12855 [Syntrophales bacterium]|jgi:hypothetical protein
MLRIKRRLFFVLFLLIISLIPLPLCEDISTASASIGQPVYSPMAEPGAKVPIGSGYYLVYGFDKKPKLGTVIMKVDIFKGDGERDTSFQVKGDSGMPSMRGAHETGDLAFQLSRKGSYLLPINIVMPGDWEIRLTILKDGKVFFRGRYNFDI